MKSLVLSTDTPATRRIGKSIAAGTAAMESRVSRRPIARGALRLVLTLGALAMTTAASAAVNFDNVAASPSGIVYPANTFAAQGVVFRSVTAPPVLVPGQKIVLTNVDPRIRILGNDNAVSPPNFAAATGIFGGGPNDVLMTFSSPVTSVQVVTDDAVETPDVVRLVALAPAGQGSFLVVKVASKLDHATAPPGNVLSLDLQGKPVSFVLFQTTDEAEGFDNLVFTRAPECSRTDRFDPDCFEIPPYEHWIQVGCEMVDCCPGCPGDILKIDWRINVDGDVVERLILQFAELPRSVAASLQVEGNASWHAELQQLEVFGPGQISVRGLTSEGASPKWSPTSARMTIGGVEAKPGIGAARTLRVKVQQQVGGQAISDSTLIYSF
jgi:hypothetical protein